MPGDALGADGDPRVADTYEFLLGRWRIERTFVEHRTHELGTFSGTVVVASTWDDHPVSARYAEDGRFVLGAYRGDGGRRLGVVRQSTGGVALRFEDGRPFVDCDLQSGNCWAVHRCGDDRYEITWHVISRDAMSERWRVLGPQKNYEAWAVLRRVSTKPAGPARIRCRSAARCR